MMHAILAQIAVQDVTDVYPAVYAVKQMRY